MIAERYIVREILGYLAWLAGLLFLIMLSHRFIDYLADAAAGKISGGLLLQLLGLKLVATLPVMLPVTLYLSILLAFSRLARDSELTILGAAGLGLPFQLRVASRFAVIFTVLLGVVVLYLAPWSEASMQSLQQRAQQEADITGISPGQFREFGEGERIVYVERLAPGGMADVFLQVREDDQLGVLTSDRARFEFDPMLGSRYIVFEDGRRYVGRPGQLDYEITHYQTYSVLIRMESPLPSRLKPEAMPTLELLSSDTASHRAEVQWRLSLLLATVMLALLAVMLNRELGKQKQYQTMLVAILVYFIYTNLLSISKNMLAREVIPGWIGLWWVHLLFAAIVLLLIYLPYMRGWRPGAGTGRYKA